MRRCARHRGEGEGTLAEKRMAKRPLLMFIVVAANVFSGAENLLSNRKNY